MPEGPSIYILREELQPFISREIINVRGNSKEDIEKLREASVSQIRSWGKHLLITLSNGITVRIHFMLFGSYSVNEKKENRKERLGLDFSNGEINFYACSVKILTEDPDDIYDWSADVMNNIWNKERARSKVLDNSEELITDVLLDQEIFAGVGNIIKNEVLFRTKVQPESIVKSIPSTKLDEIIQDARNFSFQFNEWKKEYLLRKNLQVHNKALCPRCEIKIVRKANVGKKKRRAFYCTNCQQLYE